ncbi:transmembrane protease serine 11D-like, partial [Hyperolius riggenbachi]|uniref:transmembrane protease serine 11D-like n=1 Tax=Hyperolius riggenbachi TaxID=752182 RepID=UPI0035A3C729
MNYTKETVDGLVARTTDSQSPSQSVSQSPNLASKRPQNPDHSGSMEHCKMFVGSFKLLNGTYLPEYNDSSTNAFQTAAQRINTLLNAAFSNSLLNASYRNASVFLLRPNPFIAFFQLLFCNESFPWSGINPDSVAKVLQNYTGIQQNGNILVDPQSVNMGGMAPCTPFMNAEQPWQVHLQVNQTVVCTGSLLTAFWLLSSANCITNWNISLVTVTLQTGATSQSTQIIAKIIQHPNFTQLHPTLQQFCPDPASQS